MHARPVNTRGIALTMLAMALLSSCGGGSDDAGAAADTASQPSVFDEAQVINFLGIEKRDANDFSPAFEMDTSTYADYKWTADDGTVCWVSNVITDEGEASMASSNAALNPAGTAGVEFYADTENLATCQKLLVDALGDFPA